MFRLATLIAVSFAISAAFVTSAAPIPKESDLARIKSRYGTPVDPDRDCRIDLVEDGRLRMTVPGKHHSMYSDAGHTNAPRVLREVSGDFVAAMRLTLTFNPSAQAADRELPAFVGGGWLLLDGDTGMIEFRHLQEKLGSNPWRTSAEFDVRQPGHEDGKSIPRPLYEKPIHLRLTRQGQKLMMDWSPDGKEWTPMSPNGVEVPMGRKLSIGPCAIQNTDQPMTATFDQFQITPLANNSP